MYSLYNGVAKNVRTKLISLSGAAIILLASFSGAAPLFTQKALAAGNVEVCQTSCGVGTYNTIQAGIDAAMPGDTVTVDAGNYDGSNINVNKSVSLVGETGAVVTVPNVNGTNGFNVTANDVSISGLTIEGPAVSTSYLNYGWASTVTRGIVVNNGVLGFTINDNTIEGLRNDVLIDGRNTGSLTNNTIDNSKSGVSVQYTDAGTGNSEGYNITMTGNHDSTYGNEWGLNTHLNGHYDGSTYYGNTQKIATDAPGAVQAELLANSAANGGWAVQDQGYTNSNRTAVSVATSGSDINQGSPLSPLATIRAGVTAAVSGGTVKVAAGTYNENVTINKSLTLNGAQAGISAINGRTHLDGSETILPGTNNYAASFNVTADNVTIDGFDFGQSTDNASAGPIGVDLGNSSGATVKNSIFEHNQRGISLNGASNVTVSGDLVSGNNADPENNAGIWGDNVNGININNSELDGASNTAINLATGSKNITINANIFKNDGNTAVIWQDSTVTFSNNYGRGFNGSGLFITGSSNVSVSNNDLSLGTSFNGISLSTASGVPSSGVSITGNTISGFANAINLGDASALSDTLTVHSNKLGDNSNAGINAPSNTSTLVDATSNWWGDASGPQDSQSGDGSTPGTNSGTGTTANGAVKYGPWCTSSDCSTLSNATLAAPVNLTPADGTYTNDPAFVDTWSTVAGAAKYEYETSNTRNGSNLGSIIYSDNSTSGNYSIGGGTVTRHNNGTPEGTYYWHVRAVNAEGTPGPWSTINQVTVDTTQPVITGVTPGTSTPIRGTVTFNVNATDAHPSYIYVELNHNGTWITDNTHNGTEGATSSSLTYNTANLADGTYTIKVDAVDKAGNTTEQTYNYTVDNTAPAVPTNLSWKDAGNTTIANGGYTNSYSGTASWQDSSNDVNHYVYKYWNNVSSSAYNGEANAWTTTTSSTSLPGVFNQGEGTHYFCIEAVDAAGNASACSPTFTVTYDDTAPVVHITAPTASDVHGAVVISGSVTDANPDHYYLVIKNASGTVVAGPGTVYAANVANYNWNTSSLPDGTYTIDLEARDKANNKDADSVTTKTVTVDNTAPTTPTANPTGGTYTTAQLVSLSSSDSGSGLANIYYTTDGSTPSNTNGTLYSGAFSVAANETVKAIAYDNTGNASSILTAAYTISSSSQSQSTTPTIFSFVQGGLGGGNTPAAIVASSTSGPGTGGSTTGTTGTGGTGNTTNGQVLGVSTDTPNTTNNGTSGKVKGLATTNQNAKKSSNFLGLGWWWLPILVVILLFVYGMFRASDSTNKPSS